MEQSRDKKDAVDGSCGEGVWLRAAWRDAKDHRCGEERSFFDVLAYVAYALPPSIAESAPQEPRSPSAATSTASNRDFWTSYLHTMLVSASKSWSKRSSRRCCGQISQLNFGCSSGPGTRGGEIGQIFAGFQKYLYPDQAFRMALTVQQSCFFKVIEAKRRETPIRANICFVRCRRFCKVNRLYEAYRAALGAFNALLASKLSAVFCCFMQTIAEICCKVAERGGFEPPIELLTL